MNYLLACVYYRGVSSNNNYHYANAAVYGNHSVYRRRAGHSVYAYNSLIFKLCLTMCVCCVCRPVMEDIDEQFAVSEAKAREYFIDLILGLEYCKI